MTLWARYAANERFGRTDERFSETVNNPSSSKKKL
jgi:hypothetical protein